ncbi:Six-hairpin glycosidase-like protein [Xylariales sp. PMI_506]|nr:Six-hairpin glycosidase-like protein [Xylariales sp. PMI_506]
MFMGMAEQTPDQTGSASAVRPRSYDQPLSFHLPRERPSKTIDVGRNGSSAALEPLGSILQLSAFHPYHGIVLASPYEQFDGARFRDQKYVRAYRKHMLNSVSSLTPGFGLRFDDPVDHVEIDLQTSSLATVTFDLPGGISVALSTRIEACGQLIQSAVLSSATTTVTRVSYTLGLGISVNRASYGQLTEGGPIPIPKSENHLRTHDGGAFFSVTNPHLGAHLEGCLEDGGETVPLHVLHAQTTTDVPIKAAVSRWVDILPGSETTIVARFQLFPDTEIRGGFLPLSAQLRLTEGLFQGWKNNGALGTFIIRRNLEYILGCLAVPVADHDVALMTDHVALPLGWNRDNYWQLWFMLNVRRNISALIYPEAMLEYRAAIDRVVQGHLIWVFRRAYRPQKFWHRSYLVTGKPKDGPTFQLDQQCYPLLELCDFHDNYPNETKLVQEIIFEGVPAEILTLLWSKRDAETGLFPTDETPGDDKVEYPFHFSSHVLLWYTLSRMIQLLEDVGSPSNLKIATLQEQASELQRVTMHHFVTSNQVNGEPVFAYLSDGHGHHTHYHDANDIPTLFAAKWDFIKPTRELGVWKNTMDWATSPDNAGGYFGGGGDDSQPFAGLGSVHTPDPWTLGYFQEFMYANMTGNATAQRDAWRRIRGVVLFDGTFSEAVDAATGAVTSKAWFNWPGCMIGSALIPSLKELEQIVVSD